MAVIQDLVLTSCPTMHSVQQKKLKLLMPVYPAILTELAWSIKDLFYGIKSTEKNDLRTCLFSTTEKETS